MATGTAEFGAPGDAITKWLQDAVLAYNLKESERMFLAKVQSLANHVSVYEESNLQRKVLDIVPLSDLQQRAREASELSREGGQDGVDERDCLLLELISWFGTFFKWMDKPICSECGTKTESTGHVAPTAEEQKWWVGAVEGYKCPKCGKDERFPRYNHPEKLLETRIGRCGETANCKALFCRSLGFEVRYVIDWTDHVWIEVYSEAQQRWIHCDGGKCDDNLLYETSWGKKFTYIIAFSNDEVVDVTWRYSIKHDEVKWRRMLVTEEWLCRTLARVNEERQRKLSPERRQVLLERSVKELVELLSVSKERLLGTAAWRRIQGKPESQHTSYIFTPTDEEINARCLRVRYCCDRDTYCRGSQLESDLAGWKSGAAAVNSVFRKVEHDWKAVCDYLHHRGVKEADLRTLQKGNSYLARLRGAPTGSVTWHMDFTASGLVIDSVTIVTRSMTSDGGQVLWELTGDDRDSQKLSFGSDEEIETTSCLRGSQSLRLTANLLGGKGDSAWQQAQLFPQPISSKDEFPFDVTVLLQETYNKITEV